ncbi:MAG: MFS transporter [Gammaproteobacteria bacterium]|nr:MFS transporter [Gammaproteobacteria bacterium]MYE84249.1 MFS transporter [Gammaproteobacteria bacterium]
MRMVLADSRRLRFAAFTAFYFAQGVPIGFLQIALVAWLAGQGATLAETGAFIGVVTLPWALKLVSGPFMDRYGIPSMGRRRPWVMATQGGLALSLLSLAVIPDPTDVAMLTMIGFVVMSFAAVQDVAVDGMAIDLLPVDERGRANAFMAFGQTVGYAVFSPICGYLLAGFGLPVAALVCAGTVAAIFVLVALCRERSGERALPWTPGRAGAPPIAPTNFFGMFPEIFRALVLPMSLVLIAAEFFARAAGGVFITAAPVFAVQELGYANTAYTNWYGWLTLVAACIGILFGPAIDRFGGKLLLGIGIAATAIVSVVFPTLDALWDEPVFVVGCLAAWLIASQLVFVAIIAMFMNLCRKRIAATQFAIYMSLANLSRSAGAFLAGAVSAGLTWSENFLLIAGFAAAALACLAFFSPERHARHLRRLEERETASGMPRAEAREPAS